MKKKRKIIPVYVNYTQTEKAALDEQVEKSGNGTTNPMS